MQRRIASFRPVPAPSGWGRMRLWRRRTAARSPDAKERVGFWLGLLLLFVPVFYFLLYLRRYSLTARIGWGLWLGLIVFVKLFGLSDAVVRVEIPRQGELAAPGDDPTEIPLDAYLGKLLGAQYMAHYQIEGTRLAVTYERHDRYFGDEEVQADLAISNGYSLLYRRDIEDLRLRFPLGGGWREAHLTRRGYREFFGLTDEALRTFADPARTKESPVYNVSRADKVRFVRAFVREIPAPAGGELAGGAGAAASPDQPGGAR
jgi:hypothetical protein